MPHPTTSKRESAMRSKEQRLEWFRDARFGMFMHWGLYSLLGRGEWVLNREKIPAAEYEALADQWKPKRGWARECARLAKRAGMKYMVLTAKHAEGFLLWDSKMSPYNAAQRGPGRDLVAEYVDACRAEGLRIGFYYCFMDWHHPDGEICEHDEAARKRFLDYSRGCVRELMTNYGKIDIMWYDCPWPLMSPERIEADSFNRMVRRLQPHILINDRSLVPQDFATTEMNMDPKDGQAWEACMKTNAEWGYVDYGQPEDWLTSRKVLDMIRHATLHGGNLLLNIGPTPEGSMPEGAYKMLLPIGKWLAKNGEAVYGRRVRDQKRYLDWTMIGHWTRQGNTAYYWIDRWIGSETVIAGFLAKVKRASILASGKPVKFKQVGDRVTLYGMPAANPDKNVHITVIKLECATYPHQELGMGRA
ncbi:MAG: alpha-L-fucosidase [Planctomycetaceae bacterium]|nr:alpha-L-fucosidase [Planctomycetaceae bacterium]